MTLLTEREKRIERLLRVTPRVDDQRSALMLNGVIGALSILCLDDSADSERIVTMLEEQLARYAPVVTSDKT